MRTPTRATTRCSRRWKLLPAQGKPGSRPQAQLRDGLRARLMKKAFFYCVLILLPLLIMEGFFRLLPVSNPPYLLPVSAEHPVVHYQPNIEYLSSGGWN